MPINEEMHVMSMLSNMPCRRVLPQTLSTHSYELDSKNLKQHKCEMQTIPCTFSHHSLQVTLVFLTLNILGRLSFSIKWDYSATEAPSPYSHLKRFTSLPCLFTWDTLLSQDRDLAKYFNMWLRDLPGVGVPIFGAWHSCTLQQQEEQLIIHCTLSLFRSKPTKLVFKKNNFISLDV